MNRNLLIAIALPSMMFYQSNAAILYSSEKLIVQVKEEQAALTFDLAETGNTLIITNDRIVENDKNVEGDEPVEPEQPPDQSSETRESTCSEKDDGQTNKADLPKTGKRLSTESARQKNKDTKDVLETIEQKISALPLTDTPDDKSGERELVRMLANMSGTILYGTKMTDANKHENITF